MIEKHVANSLLKYLLESNLLYELQSAFCFGHSAELALIRNTDEGLFNMDNDEITGLVINHNLLLKKLSVYGASQDSVAWFRSYLEERRHLNRNLSVKGYGRDQSSVQFYFSYLLMLCLYI